MTSSLPPAPTTPTRSSRRRQNGQVLVIFAGALIALIGIVAVVVDVSWYWANSLRVQRAADAAALAGAIYLPGNTGNAYSFARAEATKNGYTGGSGTTVTPLQDTANGGNDPRQLDVTVSAPVGTFFMRVFGINTIQATRTAKAIYVQPVPMGSPLAYYGVGCLDTNNVPPYATGEPLCTTAGNSNGKSGVPNVTASDNRTGALANNQLDSQGAWGVVFTRGGDSRNGDAFSPLTVSPGSVPNAGTAGGGFDPYGGFDPAGYNYGISIGSGTGSVSVFDPIFCDMPKLGSGISGTGDQWTGTGPGASNPNPVTTYYNLWKVVTPGIYSGDTLVYASGTRFEKGLFDDGVEYVDTSGGHGAGNPETNLVPNGTTVKNCGDPLDPSFAYHLKWWTLPTGPLAAGSYRLQITTTKVNLPAVNSSGYGGGNQPTASQPSDNVGAANRWSLEATGGGAVHIYGLGRMATYTNNQVGTQAFYLAQIDRPSGAGKTIEIDLYDPGDSPGGAWLQILNPDSGVWTPATFSYTSVSKADGTAGQSNPSTSCIEANSPGSAPGFAIPGGCPNVFDGSGTHFDAKWVKILITLDQDYGKFGLAQGGWWKIQYTVAASNDTTTWQVNILGNPVHLVVP